MSQFKPTTHIVLSHSGLIRLASKITNKNKLTLITKKQKSMHRKNIQLFWKALYKFHPELKGFNIALSASNYISGRGWTNFYIVVKSK